MNQTSPAAGYFDMPPSVAAIFPQAVQAPEWMPGWRSAWWWLLLPLAFLAFIFGSYAADPEFYRAHVLPEGYGVLELTQFLECLAGFLICLWLLTLPVAKEWPVLRRMLMLFAIACLYIGGEEMSWGQHFFHWGTPDYWGGINRQDETNLHNTNYVFNQLPQLILEIGIAVGGILLPILGRLLGGFKDWFLTLFVPSLTLLPVAVIVFSIKSLSSLRKIDVGRSLLERPSEAMELFYYMFILFYLVILARRIMLLDSLSKPA